MLAKLFDSPLLIFCCKKANYKYSVVFLILHLFGTVIFSVRDMKNWRQQLLQHQEVPKAEGYSRGGGNMEGGDVDVLIPPRVKKGIPSHLEPFNNYEIFHFSLLVSFSHSLALFAFRRQKLMAKVLSICHWAYLP